MSADCDLAEPAVTERRADSSDLRLLVEEHLSLVGILVSARLRDLPTHVRRDELMSAGLIALVLSASAYRPERGVPFRSFATFRIRGALIDELRTMDWVSRSARSRAREVDMVRAQLAAALNRQPRTGDIADALGISTAELNAVYADFGRGSVLSLDGLGLGGGSDLRPDIPTDDAVGPESLILRREQIGYLHDAVAALPERLQFVVVSYFFDQRQMSDIADDLGVSSSRVSQMCTEALALIRDGMNYQLNPDSIPALTRSGRATSSRHAYYRALGERNTVAGRLDMSTLLGEVRHRVVTGYVAPARGSRIA